MSQTITPKKDAVLTLPASSVQQGRLEDVLRGADRSKHLFGESRLMLAMGETLLASGCLTLGEAESIAKSIEQPDWVLRDAWLRLRQYCIER